MEMLWGAFDKREGLLSKGPLHIILPFAEGLRKHFLREVEVKPIGHFDFDDMYQDIINQLKKGELIEDWDCDFYEED